MTSTATDFDGFYLAHYGETVAMTYGFTADLAESQDIAQEAFSRAWQRWKVISHYEQPVSWVRRVATNLAHSRWRKLRVASAYLGRQRADDLPGLSPDHVDMVAALRNLPVAQRKAVVLHYLVDLPVAEVAAELGVSDGTVKSWLHRGRNALAAELGDEVRRTVSPPPAPELRLEADRKRLRRSIITTVAAFLAVLLMVTGIQLWREAGGGPPLPPASPTPSVEPSPTSAAPARLAPAPPASCRVERLPLPARHGPASYVSGGDTTGRYLVGTGDGNNVYIWDNGKLSASLVLDGIDDSLLSDINSAGIAIGSSIAAGGEDIPWLYRDNKFVRLPGNYAEPTAINNHNVIVGIVRGRPAIWRTPDSEPEFLAMPEGTIGKPSDISDEGLIVGMLSGPGMPPDRIPDRGILWYPNGTFAELPLPPGVERGQIFRALRVRGDWVAGDTWMNKTLVALRWNLRTGKAEVIADIAGATALNEHGWIGTGWDHLVIRTDTGQTFTLPNTIPGLRKGETFESLEELSDDGRRAAGQLTIGSTDDFDNVAVRWVCQ